MKRNWLVGTIIAALAVIVYLVVGWPVQQAINQFNVADADYDNAGKCLAAEQVAREYARLGWTERSQEWQKKGALDCALAQLEGSL